MIRFAFTPSTIKHSFDSHFRNKGRRGQSGKRSSYSFVKIGLVAAVFLAVFVAGRFVLKNRGTGTKPPPAPSVSLVGLKPEDWRYSDARKAGERKTLTIGGAEYGFVWIPAGEFDMGSPTTERDRDDNETLHHVKLTKGFWMLETETPQALYKEIAGENPSEFKGDNLPVERVSWNDATEFCRKLTERLPEGLTASLPTEAQWEYACRAGTTAPFSFGNVLNGDEANCDGNYPYGTPTKGAYLKKTTPVKHYDPSPWGLYDMHGNVWEWCLDYFGDYPTGTAIDPKGPDNASNRVERGGSWGNVAGGCRSANREWNGGGDRGGYLGFRFVLIYDGPSSRAEESANPDLVEEVEISNQTDEKPKNAGQSDENGSSSGRESSTRRTLTIGNAEYGFVWIPAGEFDMGSPETEAGRESDETLHHVRLTEGFWMLETETPQALYEEVMGENPSRFKGDNLPAEKVSWNDATKFCKKLTKRIPDGLTASLPTEAQWEYACRAGTTTPFSFGDVLNGDKANCDGNNPYGTSTKGAYVEKTTPVKSYDPNPWGLYDMHGNVREWCLDYYGDYPDYGDYPAETAIDPNGPNRASNRATRGGSWGHDAGNCRSACRYGHEAASRTSYLGFRFVLIGDWAG